MSQQQQQQDDDEGTVSPASGEPAPGVAAGAIDPWASLSAAEDDFAALAASAAAATATARPSADDLDEPPDPDAMARFHAEANAAAVEAAAILRGSEEDPSADSARAARRSGGGTFTIPLLCFGIALIAACLLIPQVDANRRLVYERLKLQNDLETVEKQVEVNDQFLRMAATDADLAERLAQRQMKVIRKGSEVLELKDAGGNEMSPYQLTAITPPPEVPPYQSRGGILAKLTYNPKSRLYLMGVGLLSVAIGLVMGVGPKPND